MDNVISLQSTYSDLYQFYKKRQYLCKQNHHQTPSSASNVMTTSQAWFLTLTSPFQCIVPNTFSHFCKGSHFISSRFPVTRGSTDTVWHPDASSFYVSRAPPALNSKRWLHHWSPACYFWCTWNNWQRIYVETITAINKEAYYVFSALMHFPKIKSLRGKVDWFLQLPVLKTLQW